MGDVGATAYRSVVPSLFLRHLRDVTSRSGLGSRFLAARLTCKHWLSVDSYLTATLLDLDAKRDELREETKSFQREVALKSEVRARSLAGQHRPAGLAVSVASITAGMTIVTTFSLTLLTVLLNGMTMEYGLTGAVPVRVAEQATELMEYMFWPVSVGGGVLLTLGVVVFAGALTRDKAAALAAMRRDAYAAVAAADDLGTRQSPRKGVPFLRWVTVRRS